MFNIFSLFLYFLFCNSFFSFYCFVFISLGGFGIVLGFLEYWVLREVGEVF